ncbi:rhodanese-like domain-containing protein [Kitasatospora sp. NPDC056181]|uniref:rhodanese-like domain-containing protein n=1 Tax=Kitasatospora sp. NPDC056181 TaxID=3345737 RepID=UPI0035DA89D0
MLLSHQPPAPRQADPAQAERMLSAGLAVLLDVRERDEFAAGHAPAAVPLPLGLLAVLGLGGELPPGVAGRTVLVVCRSGHRSQQAATLLAAQGVDAVNVAGGMRAWAGAGLPVVSAHGAGGQVI